MQLHCISFCPITGHYREDISTLYCPPRGSCKLWWTHPLVFSSLKLNKPVMVFQHRFVGVPGSVIGDRCEQGIKHLCFASLFVMLLTSSSNGLMLFLPFAVKIFWKALLVSFRLLVSLNSVWVWLHESSPCNGKQHLCGLPVSTDLASNVHAFLHVVLLCIHLKVIYRETEVFNLLFSKGQLPHPLFFSVKMFYEEFCWNSYLWLECQSHHIGK